MAEERIKIGNVLDAGEERVPITAEQLELVKQQARPFNIWEYAAQSMIGPTLGYLGTGSPLTTGFLPLDEKRLAEAAQQPPVTEEQMKRRMGITPMEAPDAATRMLGSGIRAIYDPASYLGGLPLKGIPALARAGAGALSFGGIGATTELGGTIGEDIGERVGVPTAGRVIGSLSAGLATPVLTSSVTRGGIGAVKNIAEQIHQKYKQVKINPEQAEQAVAASSAKRLLQNIATSAGVENIDDLTTVINDASRFVQGVNAPLLVAASANPVAREELIRMIKTRPEYAAAFQRELDQVAANIDAKADSIFGVRYATIPNIERLSQQAATRATNLRKAASEVSDEIDKVADPFYKASSQYDLGTRISKLVESRKNIVREEMAPQYKLVLEDAKKAGAKLPENSVRDIYNFVVDRNLRDVFGKNSVIDKLITQHFAPKDGDFFPVNFEQIDSLKRRINELQRKPLSATEARQLSDLEEMVKTARQNIPGNFNQRLLDLDKQYYERLGVPFDTATAKSISSAKYAEQVAPVIIKNKSSLTDFLRIAGEDGIAIADNAFMGAAAKAAAGEQGFSIAKLKRFIRLNEDALNLVPDTKKKLEAALQNTDDLLLKSKRLDEQATAAEDAVANNTLIKFKTPDYRQIARNINDNAKRADFFKQLKDLSPRVAASVRRRVRREYLEMVKEKGEGLAFFENPQNQAAITELFGKNHIANVKKIMRLSDAASKVDVNTINTAVNTKVQDSLYQLTGGIDIPFFTSTYRDRISSLPQKAVRLLSRINTVRLSKAYDEQVFALFTDPQGTDKLAKVGESIDFKLNNPKGLTKTVEAIKEILPAAIYISVFQPDEPTE